ncbi:hypothetical protein [Dyadobacter psychrotolerans]|uniref:Outer membrane protein beta-barrel domain-containing protein n=1 Tax=Dyadobacter psychrotolerans TaxID=2541721 RepID=A0A4V2Z4G6_9BACT|nr:hypothetical protein [Dyadobacter psychrotolerans]TDE16588.1 hypothetical protein E0F88_10155 [Dyadobacter psychrotolerans]
MKTDKFEKTIRQKLESITPDFQEDDWAKMQNYMHAHTPPGFWQQYGSWLGYAAAASVTTVMAFLYMGQVSQTKDLASDVKKLQNQIEVIKNAPVLAPKTDTIYIVQKEVSKDQFFSDENSDLQREPQVTKADDRLNNLNEQRFETPEENNQNGIINEGLRKRNGSSIVSENPAYAESKTEIEKATGVNEKVISQRSNETTERTYQHNPEQKSVREFAGNQSGKKSDAANNYSGVSAKTRSGQDQNSETSLDPASSIMGKTLGEDFDQLSELESLQLPDNSRKLNYALANRMSGKQVKRILLANAPAAQKTVAEDKKVEKTTKAENTIPRLNLKVPYRFGGGIQFEGGNQVKTVLGEVLVSKKFSVSTGVSWVKIKPMEFFTEKIFREKNRQDFKRSHPNEVPVAFEVLNIQVNPSLVQIPLTVAFRNELKNDFSYYASAGTNITVKGREQYAFDCRLPMPGQEFRNQSFEKKMDIPAMNSLNLSVGIEKTWHPIVVQVEGYLYNYFKPISRESAKTGPGVKLKLLYQIGRKM